jgi:GGDEF domain-containing protein
MAGLTPVVSAAFVVAFLGWLPIEGAAEARVLAHLAVSTAVGLALMLMSTLGMLRHDRIGPRAVSSLLAGGATVLVVGWMLEAGQALALASIAALTLALVMLVVSVRRARRGERGGWDFVAGLLFVLVALGGLSWIAITRTTSWPVHAVSAVAAAAYLCVIARVLWARYSYLLELAEVMAHGPSYDPVTRMRSHSETGQMVGDAFFKREGDGRPIGVIAVCIGNLYALENLHGRAAFNHALFVCAGRLRRSVPDNVGMGRLGDDGFLLLARSTPDIDRLAQLARHLRERLSRPISLSTSRDPAVLEAASTTWVAEAGLGVLATSTEVRPSQAVAAARAMARTAWSYPSRLAFFDQDAGQIAELPPEEGAWAPETAPMPT